MLPWRWVLSAFLLATPVDHGQNADAIRRALEARYQHAKTLKAIFYERYEDGNGGISAESGVVYFSRPGRMRWEYDSPERKLFLVDGKNAWLYVPADHTASRAKVKESSDWRTPLALLTGKADLSKICGKLEIFTPGAGAHANSDVGPDSASRAAVHVTLRCIPRGAGDGAAGAENILDVLLETDPDARLARIVIRQAGNAQTEFRFGNWEENIPITEAQFHFQAPPGTSIVDENSLADSVH